MEFKNYHIGKERKKINTVNVNKCGIWVIFFVLFLDIEFLLNETIKTAACWNSRIVWHREWKHFEIRKCKQISIHQKYLKEEKYI